MERTLSNLNKPQVRTVELLEYLYKRRKMGNSEQFIVVPLHEEIGLVPVSLDELIKLVERDNNKHPAPAHARVKPQVLLKKLVRPVKRG